ncbi:MAG: hypothetical protein K6G55_07100 [Selenomonadaceae bacterium]|nr:hypothetical protein [Selenomonadaceae bacterium]
MKYSRKLIACATLAMFVIVMTAVAIAAESSVDWGRGVIRVVGNGVGNAKYARKPGQYRLTARQAARMDAQRKLVDAIEGVQVTAESSMKDFELEYDVVKTASAGLIKNATEVGDAKFFDDGTCEVVMEMNMYGAKNSVASAAFLPFKNEKKSAFPKPKNKTVINNTTIINNNYTGLVVDCSGMDINYVMSPVIKNAEGTPIYGHENLDYDKIIVTGMASYADDAYDNISRARAGNNPLVVKAVKLSDLNANPVVSVEDADKILAANSHDKFLDNCSVVFVK